MITLSLSLSLSSTDKPLPPSHDLSPFPSHTRLYDTPSLSVCVTGSVSLCVSLSNGGTLSLFHVFTLPTPVTSVANADRHGRSWPGQPRDSAAHQCGAELGRPAAGLVTWPDHDHIQGDTPAMMTDSIGGSRLAYIKSTQA